MSDESQVRLGMILDLYAALQYRETCPNCGGRGFEYMDDGTGEDVAAESCGCSNVAFEILDRYAAHFESFVQEYVALGDNPKVQVSETATFAIEELMEKWSNPQ